MAMTMGAGRGVGESGVRGTKRRRISPLKEMDIHANNLWDRELIPPVWR
jgi:hypothetical protein